MQEPTEAGATPLAVLIVDGDRRSLDDCRRLIHAGDADLYAVTQASRGEEALRLSKTQSPDCIVLTWRLPDMDALDFLGRLRMDRPDLDAPVVLLASPDDKIDRLAARRLGVHQRLDRQSLGPDSLDWAIENAVEAARSRRERSRQAELLERRAAALHDSEERFSRFMHAFPGGAWIKDIDGAYVFVTQAFARAFHMNSGQNPGAPGESDFSEGNGRRSKFE